MGDTEQDAINALRAAGLEREAQAVEQLRRLHKETMDAYHAGQRASYAAGQEAERERCELACMNVRGFTTTQCEHFVAAIREA